ncbi:hypothetical protein ACFPJ1_40845 [Kribbella qitaiheensis]|uniref:hypothetical protein n=1 Tax=Kribbella qitaiheensis TaxID=1544730 RepID=UPI003605BEFA
MSNQHARDIVINTLTARHEELHDGEAMPRDHQGGDKIIRALQEGGFQIVAHPAPEQPNVAGALDIAAECARYDGGHHKQWVFDQMVRNLTGCPMVPMVNESAVGGPYHFMGLGESEAYREFRAANPHWTEGIAP